MPACEESTLDSEGLDIEQTRKALQDDQSQMVQAYTKNS